MRIAVFSDLHGNPFACQALLEDLATAGSLDAIVAAGDLCLGGSDPAKCIQLLTGAGVIGVYGNTDQYILYPDRTPSDELHRRQWDRIQPAALWVRAQLAPRQLAWLQTLPFEQRFRPAERPGDDLLVVHANPQDVEHMILPSTETQIELWGEIRQPDDDPYLTASLQNCSARTIAFGHFHHPFVRAWKDKLLVNIAGCSLPSIDHNPQVRYTIFTWQAACWQLERRQCAYPVDQELAALSASRMPFSEDFIATYR